MIAAGDSRGAAALYESFHRGMRYLAARYCPQHADDCVHDAVIEVIQQIKQRQVKNGAALPGYIRTVLKRTCWDKHAQVCRHDGEADTAEAALERAADTRENALNQLERQERVATMRRGLERLTPRQREILKRFYLEEQTPDVICAEMNLTDTQFRLLKSRSKQQLEHVIRRGMDHSLSPTKIAYTGCAS